MYEDYKQHFKEVSPVETVKKLKAKLEEIGVELEENWSDESYINTYSLRVTIKGTPIGTNGKGVSREYALASAYAEFFERYQNNLLGVQHNLQGVDFDFYECPDEKIRTAKEIVKDNDELTKLFFHNRGLEEASTKAKCAKFEELIKADYISFGLEDQYVTMPYYSVKEGKVQYISKTLLNRYYGSNGMCAGNTSEEALVQGISEILERVAQRKLFIEKPVLPTIPDEYIAKFPYIYERYTKLKACEDYTVMLKDCSFGGKYPVAALVIIEKNTGFYGIKLGCHPNYCIAMERALTEATQGHDIFTYARRSYLDFSNVSTNSYINIYNSYKIGVGQYPYQVFGTKPTYEFTPFEDISNKSNADLLKIWTNRIIQSGYDVLIRDNTSLGLPAFHVIVPGLSEMMDDKDILYRAYNTRQVVAKLVMDPTRIKKDNTKYIIASMNYYMDSILENTVDTYAKMIKGFPGSDFGADCRFYIAMCHVNNGEFDKAAKNMSLVVKQAKQRGIEQDQINFYNAVFNYCEAMVSIGDHKEVMEYMRLFYKSDLCQKLEELFIEPEEVMVKVYRMFLTMDSVSEGVDVIKHAFRVLRAARNENTVEQSQLQALFS